MPKPNPYVYLPLLERALESPVGISIETNNPKALRQELLAIKREKVEFENLITFLPEGLNEVFICHKSVELPE
jgi:hypothetical protein